MKDALAMAAAAVLSLAGGIGGGSDVKGNCKNRYRIVGRGHFKDRKGNRINVTRITAVPTSKYNPIDCRKAGKR